MEKQGVKQAVFEYLTLQMNETAQNSYENLFSEPYLFVKPINVRSASDTASHHIHKKSDQPARLDQGLEIPDIFLKKPAFSA